MAEMREIEYKVNGIPHTAQFTEAGAKLHGHAWEPRNKKVDKQEPLAPEAPKTDPEAVSTLVAPDSKATKAANKAKTVENK